MQLVQRKCRQDKGMKPGRKKGNTVTTEKLQAEKGGRH